MVAILQQAHVTPPCKGEGARTCTTADATVLLLAAVQPRPSCRRRQRPATPPCSSTARA
jgi:hypothetical protein